MARLKLDELAGGGLRKSLTEVLAKWHKILWM